MSLFLTILVFSPLIGLVLLAFTPKTQEKFIKIIGFSATLPALLMAFHALGVYLSGNPLSQFAEDRTWIMFAKDSNLFSIDYELGLSGLSLVMVVLTALLATLAAIASIYVKKEWKGFFMLYLLLEVGMLGVFTAENLILFFIFFEITLIPTFFLIGKWGYFEKEKAAFSFLIYNGVGSAIFLLVILILFAKTGTTNIADLTAILQIPIDQGAMSKELRYGLLIALVVAFGVKLPIFPLHTWMLRVHVQAPIPTVMLHSGILLKIGAYGIIRFAMGLFPNEFQSIAGFIALLGVINLLYGALLAFVQNDFKMVLAYSSISHMGIVLIGLGAFNEAGIQGAIFQVVSHGLIASLLFFIVGIIYERVETTEIDKLGNMAKVMPLTAGFLLAAAMASLGLPGMSGFISEFMAFLGLFKELPVLAAVGTIGIILTAVYLLRAVLNMTFGTANNAYKKTVDIRPVEMFPVLVLLAFIVFIGVYPSILTDTLQSTLETIMHGIGGGRG